MLIAAGCLFLLGQDPAPGTGGDGAEGHVRRLQAILAERVPRGKVIAVSDEIGLVVISAGKDQGAAEGDECEISRGDEFVARLVIDRADRLWSAGNVIVKRVSPRVGDDASSVGRLSPERRRAFLDFLFSFRSVTEEDRAHIHALLEKLDSDDIETREKATQALLQGGAPTLGVLRALDLGTLGAEAKARVQDVLREMDRYRLPIERHALERDVAFLSLIDDPRASGRLKGIVGHLRPFCHDGFPERRADFREYLRGWWVQAKDRLRWEAAADRYVEK